MSDLFSTGKPLPKFIREDGNIKRKNRTRADGLATYKAWVVECWCGNQWRTTASAIRAGRIKQCRLHRGIKHGKHLTSEYSSWKAMKSRCYREKNIRYDRYGGRGISVCDRWRNSFENFYADMGDKPASDYTIDRINPDGNYEPSNCRWADKLTQTLNTNYDRSKGVYI